MMWSFFSRDPSKDFPYEIGEIIFPASEVFIWNLHKAKKKSTGEDVTVFTFGVKNSSNAIVDVAKNSVKRLKSLRHPSILTYLDSHESDKVIFLATECVEPLVVHLQSSVNDIRERELYLSWGIFQITRALSFLNNDGNLRHNNVCLSSIYVNQAGEWKLGNVEYMAGLSEGEGIPVKIFTALEKYSPPESADTLKQRQITKSSTDMWGLGCLLWEVYNGSLPQQSALKNIQKIPRSMLGIYNELTASSPKTRPNPADVITRCRKPDGFFKNDLVDTLLFLEEIQIKDKNETNKFFTSLAMLLDHFPNSICRFKILPHLINALEYGEAGVAILSPLLKLGNLLEDVEYQKKIVPCVVKLFNCNDRITRSKLLQHMEHYIDHLQSSTINDQIFPQIANGFLDTNSMIREQTIKSVIYLAPKLNYNNLNVEIMRHFARLQSKDDQSGIRTNTTVCLGKIAQHLHPQIRQKVLISAFVRAMRDPFPPARIAGILALAATQQYFLMSDVSSRILPALCQLTIDPDKTVRDQVFRTIKGFLGKLEKLSEDPTLKDSMEADVDASTTSISNAAATWAGWAVTAVTAKFYRSQSETTNSTTPKISKNIHKPCSLEQPLSSSSISTNTTASEVTSMASFEQEDKALDSVSDYEENWGDINGDMQTTNSNSAKEANESKSNNNTDGWDDDDWSPIEVAVPEKEIEIKPVEPSRWNKSDWNSVIELDEAPKRVEDSKVSREEMRLQRKKEMEQKKTNKRSGPMKLGAKKL